MLAQFTALLQLDKAEVTEKTAGVIASLAKTENNREALTDQKLVSKLCQVLSEANSKKDNSSLSLIKQICRALGNLCYENGNLLFSNFHPSKRVILFTVLFVLCRQM